jgi:predicted  nucleic acid-binding Zn-ribbon protein
MHADFDHLIRLAQLDLFSENARQRIADHPNLVQGLDTRLATATAALDTARAKSADNQASRRAIEKDLAIINARLSKFKDQLMEVKTNKEYTAMLKEIEAAQTELRRLEDQLLERMLEADDLTTALKDAEARLAADKNAIAEERGRLEEETARLQRELEQAVASRARVVAETTPAALSAYETVRSRRGVAVVEVRGGYCSACHVRLRPQVANELRKRENLFQCESCQRFLYHPSEAPETEAGAGP